MPSGDEHQSSKFTKLLYIGDSGTGKTGSLVSLLQAGYNIKAIDMDNGLDSLIFYAKQAQVNLKEQLEYFTFRDKYSASLSGPIIRGQPKAFTDSLAKMTEWSSIEDDKTIFLLDSGSSFGKAAFEWAKFMNPGAKDPRQWYFSAQQVVENTISMITSEAFMMNVILISHVNYKELTEGVHKGYANMVGSALGPIVARYFNTLILAESIGSGKNVKRRIKTVPTGVIDLKISNPTIEAELPLETGMAEIFKLMRE